MNQERVTTENTEEKAAEVTTQSETTQQPEKAIRPKGKWFGRGIYGSRMSHPHSGWPDRCPDRGDRGNDYFLRGTRWIQHCVRYGRRK